MATNGTKKQGISANGRRCISVVSIDRGKSGPHVESAEKDSVDEIRDAKQVPDQERLAETKPIIAGDARCNPRGGHRHGDVAQSGGPSEAAWQQPLLVGHQESQANESPSIQGDQKHRWKGDNKRAPAGKAQAYQEKYDWRQEGDGQRHGRLIPGADERAVRGQPIHCAKPHKSAEEQDQVPGVHVSGFLRGAVTAAFLPDRSSANALRRLGSNKRAGSSRRSQVRRAAWPIGRRMR